LKRTESKLTKRVPPSEKRRSCWVRPGKPARKMLKKRKNPPKVQHPVRLTSTKTQNVRKRLTHWGCGCGMRS